MPLFMVLLLGLAVPLASTKNPPNALALLSEVSQRYADAKSYHLEVVEERNRSNELLRHWDKTLFTVIVSSDGRYRYEGYSGAGSVLMVSDRTTAWNYHPVDHVFKQEPASGPDPLAGKVIAPEEIAVLNVKNLYARLSHMADWVKSADFRSDETIAVNGKNIDCYVVHYIDEPSKQSDVTFDWTLWIDKSRKVVLKTFSHGATYSLTMARGRIPEMTETTTTFSVAELDAQEPASSFTFVPPADAKLVAEFPNDFMRTPELAAASLLGKPAPEIRFKSANGDAIALSSYRGQPVFIEFWATWCGPCVDLLPALSTLHEETREKGLVWIGIDSDEDAGRPAAFLSREHISWANYHDENGAFGTAFHRTGIPLGVLIDAEGKIVFHKTGYTIAELRAAISALGPQFSQAATVKETK